MWVWVKIGGFTVSVKLCFANSVDNRNIVFVHYLWLEGHWLNIPTYHCCLKNYFLFALKKTVVDKDFNQYIHHMFGIHFFMASRT